MSEKKEFSFVFFPIFKKWLLDLFVFNFHINLWEFLNLFSSLKFVLFLFMFYTDLTYLFYLT
jgi:hypothetical protein